MKKTQKNEKREKNRTKNKSKKNKISKNLTKLYGSVCSSQYTIKAKKGPFAGINQFNQIGLNEKGQVMWGKGIQLWKGEKIADMKGYVKEHDWNDPNNYRIRYWELNNLGPGKYGKLLPKSNLMANGTMKTINAGGTYLTDNKKVHNFATSFDATGTNFEAIVE